MRSTRTYIAGLGSSGALLAAVFAGFLGLGAIVAFDGLPGSSASSDDAPVIAQSRAPEIAAVSAAAPAAAAPAAAPTPLPAAAVAAPGSTSPPAGGPSPSSPGAPGTPDGSDGPGNPGDPGNPDAPPPQAPPQAPPAPPPAAPVPTGDVSHLVNEIDETVTGVTGLDLDLGGKTKPITDILDNTVNALTGGRGLGLGNLNLPDLPRVVDLSGLNGALP